ncbi:MAG: hypothetical protein NC483_05185 [Ruminococcus sp.]|nr:hypothetical protein [Ruminococcus sp.]
MKEYPYYDMFNFTEELGDAIATIINSKEGTNYACARVDCTIPEHKGQVWVSPLDGYNPWGGGLNALSGAERRAIDEKYGHFVDATIPAESINYLILIEADKLERLQSIKFTSYEEIKGFLKALCPIYLAYTGYFNPNVFYAKFPYLKSFFDALNKWRAETGRVTIDDDVLNACLQEALESLRRVRTKESQ